MTSWTAQDIGSQHGRTVIVTGATSGLGQVTATRLAAAGAHVVLAVRSAERGARAAAAMGGDVEVRELDLADLASVRAFAADWTDPIDVLVNNAGIMLVPLARTVDGFESQFGTNHLGHFALTNLLLPLVTDRVVTVSSSAHRGASIDLDDLSWTTRPYRSWAAYGQSKLANLLFTLELQRRLTADGSAVRALAAHPGYAASGLQGSTGKPMLDGLLRLGNAVMAQSPEMGALPSLYAATQDLPGGSYVGPDGLGEQRGHPKLVRRSAAAGDLDLAARLWLVSEQLTGVTYPALNG
jgi:NAD(P)-dependent dehydrogenase (short-subunit alcohol dehydrogenase family)